MQKALSRSRSNTGGAAVPASPEVSVQSLDDFFAGFEVGDDDSGFGGGHDNDGDDDDEVPTLPPALRAAREAAFAEDDEFRDAETLDHAAHAPATRRRSASAIDNEEVALTVDDDVDDEEEEEDEDLSLIHI